MIEACEKHELVYVFTSYFKCDLISLISCMKAWPMVDLEKEKKDGISVLPKIGGVRKYQAQRGILITHLKG